MVTNSGTRLSMWKFKKLGQYALNQSFPPNFPLPSSAIFPLYQPVLFSSSFPALSIISIPSSDVVPPTEVSGKPLYRAPDNIYRMI